MQWHTAVNFHSVSYRAACHQHLIGLLHSTQCGTVISDRNVVSILPICAALLLILMQFNTVSLAFDSQLLSPWRRAFKTSCSIVLLLHYSCCFCPPLFCSFLAGNLGWEISMAPWKAVLPCKQLPLQDKLLLFPLRVVLILVWLKPSVGIMMSKSQLCVTQIRIIIIIDSSASYFLGHCYPNY